jgi:hypothetical protein
MFVQTATYCTDCLSKLSPATATTADDKRMLRAHQFYSGSPSVGLRPRSERGQCIQCGKQTEVVFYEDSREGCV